MDIYNQHIAKWPRAIAEAAIRRRVQTVSLNEKIILARILGRHKIFLHSEDLGFACHLMLDGFWEMWLTQFLARRVEKGMTIVDVGANFGYYTLLFGEGVGERGRVLAVEPNPMAIKLLERTVNLNGFSTRTEVIPKALGEREGTGILFSPLGEPKNASIVQADQPGGICHDVQITSLDELVEERKVGRVDLVKIDAEGSEVRIVSGMQRLIERDKPAIVLEYNAARYMDPRGFFEELVDRYGRCQEIEADGGLRPISVDVAANPALGRDRLLFFQ
jgi:FkbM family methyltransferase